MTSTDDETPIPQDALDEFADMSLYDMPGHLIRRLQQIAVSIFLDETADSQITTVQFVSLAAVRALPGLDQMELSRAVAFDRSTIQDVIIRLEKKDLLRREADPADRRRRVLYVTPAGEKVLDEIAPANRRAQARILAPLSPEERRAFMAMLSRLVDVNNRYSRAPLVEQRAPNGEA